MSAELAPVVETLRAHAAETETRGRPSPASVEALRGAGLFALGRVDQDPLHLFETLLRLAAACPASSWVVGTSAVSRRLALSTLGEDVVAELIDPDAPTCGTGQPTGEVSATQDGLRLDGSWRWISGCGIAEVAVLCAQAPSDGAVAPRVNVVPTAAVTIVEDWDVAGMRGTGSHTVRAERVRLDPAASAPFAVDASFPLFSAVSVVAPVLGAAVGALGSVRGQLGADHGSREIGQADDLVARGVSIARAACQQISARGSSATMEDASHLRASLGDAARNAVAAFEPLLDAVGAGAFRAEQPLQRFWRDAAVGSRHPLIRGGAVAKPPPSR